MGNDLQRSYRDLVASSYLMSDEIERLKLQIANECSDYDDYVDKPAAFPRPVVWAYFGGALSGTIWTSIVCWFIPG